MNGGGVGVRGGGGGALKTTLGWNGRSLTACGQVDMSLIQEHMVGGYVQVKVSII